jgi:hypothetical protein
VTQVARIWGVYYVGAGDEELCNLYVSLKSADEYIASRKYPSEYIVERVQVYP